MSQEHAAEERRDMVQHLNGCVRSETATERNERRERGAREGIEVWIEECVALKSAERRTDASHGVDGHVVHGQFEKQLEDHRDE